MTLSLNLADAKIAIVDVADVCQVFFSTLRGTQENAPDVFKIIVYPIPSCSLFDFLSEFY